MGDRLLEIKNVDPWCKADLRHCDLDKFNAHRGQLAPKVCSNTVTYRVATFLFITRQIGQILMGHIVRVKSSDFGHSSFVY